MDDLIKELDLPIQGKMEGSDYVIDMDNSDDFSLLYNIISTNKDFRVEDGSIANINTTMFVFENGYYDITLTGDFNKNIYRLRISVR